MRQRQGHPNRTRQYHKRQAKARQRRRRTATERLQRDRRQAQHAAEALQQALDDLGLPQDLVTPRSKDACAASTSSWAKSSG